jgi:uncharacterized protein (TIGR00255 family)
VISMTGYAFLEGESQGWTYSIEIKSYNNRYLDLSLNLPTSIQSKEPEIRSYVLDQVSRGRVEIVIRLEDPSSFNFEVDQEAVAQTVQMLAQIRSITGIGGAIDLDHLLHFVDVFKKKSKFDVDFVWNMLSVPFEQAFQQFIQSRILEGSNTKKDIYQLVNSLIENSAVIKNQAQNVETNLLQNFKKRIQELKLEVDSARLYSEVAIYVIRFGIHEELMRLESHLNSFLEWIDKPTAVGKKLDFLCQEINREINTISSKTNLAEVQIKVVEMKDAIENIREQLRNVE